MLVKFSSLAGGVFCEVPANDRMEYEATDRCFRFDNGCTEYAYFGDLVENGDRARWFHHQYRERDFTFA